MLSGGQKAVVGILAGCGGLLVLCCGGSGAVLVAQVRQVAVRQAAETRVADEDRGRAAETRVMLEQIADQVRSMPELPAELPESPPEDAWGMQVRYRRSTERRAVLTSAGPDGNFANAADNVIVEVLID
jgi:hypothetical protein